MGMLWPKLWPKWAGYDLSSVCYKTTLITGGVRGARAGPPTSRLGMLLLWSLALSMPIYNNFQIYGPWEKPNLQIPILPQN